MRFSSLNLVGRCLLAETLAGRSNTAICLLYAAVCLFPVVPIRAQTPPEIGYVFPPSGAPGSTVDVRVGGYNWTPDMQLLVHDPRVKLELAGNPSEVIVPEPPYWFGKKARDNDFPLPREFPARLTIAPDAPGGVVRWQAANANGATASGVLVISGGNRQLESSADSRLEVEPIASLPVEVIGQIQKLEEVDRYAFTAARTGLVSLDLWTRRLGSQMNVIVEVRNAAGQLVTDGADTAGHDLQLTFPVRATESYTISLYDVDFRGHRSFVYRLLLQEGPRVLAAIPAAGKRGETRPVEFVGIGIASGEPKQESVMREVTFPTDPQVSAHDYRLETPFGSAAPFSLRVSDLPESVEGTSDHRLEIPVAVTGALDVRRGEDRFQLSGKRGDVWRLTGSSAKAATPLDPVLTVFDAGGKELARADDRPGSTDAELLFTVPADGVYQIAIADHSGQSGNRSAVYRMTIDSPARGFTLSVADQLPVPLGGKANLAVKVVRHGGFAEPISLELAGMPPGVSAPSPLVVPADKSELAVELNCAADAPTNATLIRVQGTATIGGSLISHPSDPLVLAVVMKPRAKITPEGLDDVRKWPRGSTYLAPVLVERLEGFDGEVVLEQTAHQQRVRQGITGPDFLVPSGVTRVEYPVFLPEWLETTKTSRIILNAVTKAPDSRGAVRHLLNKMDLRIGMLPVGALLKIAHDSDDLRVAGDRPFEIAVHLTRSAELTEPARVEIIPPRGMANRISVQPVTVSADESTVILQARPTGDGIPSGDMPLTIRATVLREGRWPVVSETTCDVAVRDRSAGF